MNRPVKLLVIFIGTVAAAVVLALVFSYFYFSSDRILAVVKPQLEKNLDRAVEITGAKLSFWGGLGVRLEGITIGNVPGFTQPHLLHLDALDVKVRTWPLLSGDVRIDRIVIGPGDLRMEIDDQGQKNWTNVVKPDTSIAPTGIPDSVLAAMPPIPVAGRMEFDDVNISFDDRENNISAELVGVNGDLSLDSAPDGQAAEITGSLTVDDGEFRTAAYTQTLTTAQPAVDFVIAVDPSSGQVDLRKIDCEVFGIPIDFSGEIRISGDPLQYTISSTVEPTPLSAIFGQLADSLWQPFFPSGAPAGSFDAEVVFHSPTFGGGYPEPEGKLRVTELAGQYGEDGIPFSAAGVEVRLTRTVASVSSQSLSIAGIPLTLNATLDQPGAPDFSGGISGSAPMTELAGILAHEQGVVVSGNCAFSLSAFGVVKNWQSMNLNGYLDFQNISWHPDDPTALPLDNLSGRIGLKGTGVTVENLQIQSGESSINLSGSIAGLVPYLTHAGRDVAIPRFDFSATSAYLDLDSLFPDDKASQTGGKSSPMASAPPIHLIELIADGTIRVDSGIYFGVPFGGFDGRLHFADRQLKITEAGSRVYGGAVTGGGMVDFADLERPMFSVDASATKIEANDFLEDFTGFGGHLFGGLDLNGIFVGKGADAREIVQSLTAKGTAAMKNGRFAGLKFLETLGRQAGLSGIRDSGPIEEMTADYWIEASRLYCRDWKINSSGILYNLAGSVGFDGSLDYRIAATIPTGEGGGLLSTLGGFLGGGSNVKINLSLTGTYAKPVVGIDSSDNRKSFEKNLQDRARHVLDGLIQPK